MHFYGTVDYGPPACMASGTGGASGEFARVQDSCIPETLPRPMGGAAELSVSDDFVPDVGAA